MCVDVKCIHVCFRCVWRSVCKNFCFSWTWQVILILGLVTLNWHRRHMKDHGQIRFCILQLWWLVCQADAACSDDTTFTPLMGFYMSFLATAATCWLETANTDPSHCWVSPPDDGCDQPWLMNVLCTISKYTLLFLHFRLLLFGSKFECVVRSWLGWWQKNWSDRVSGGGLWTPPVCRGSAVTRRWKVAYLWKPILCALLEKGLIMEMFDILFLLQIITATRVSRRVCGHRARIL